MCSTVHHNGLPSALLQLNWSQTGETNKEYYVIIWHQSHVCQMSVYLWSPL